MKTKNKKSAPAASFRVVLTSTAASFFRPKEKEAYSTLGFGAPGSDAHAKASEAIRELAKVHRVDLEGTAEQLKTLAL